MTHFSKRLSRHLRPCVLSLIAALVVIGLHSPFAAAHWADLSVADVVVGETTAQMTLTVPTNVVDFADADGNGKISPDEFLTQRSALLTLLQDTVSLVDSSQSSGEMSIDLQTLPNAEQAASHSTFFVQYRWAAPIEALQMRYDLFPSASADAQCLVTVAWQGATQTVIFRPGDEIATLTPTQQPAQQFLNFAKLGAEHMFTGYDHVLFLLALLLPGGRLVHQLRRVSIFTLGYSATLALGTLGVVGLPTMLVESAIALSIIYIAVENLVRQPSQFRWAITPVFGLIHGLGFANMLQDLIGHQRYPILQLTSFNLGIVLGQCMIVLLVLIGTRLLQSLMGERLQRQVRTAVWACSLGMVVLGGLWFTERALAVGL